jgi:hypothetical protein
MMMLLTNIQGLQGFQNSSVIFLPFFLICKFEKKQFVMISLYNSHNGGVIYSDTTWE